MRCRMRLFLLGFSFVLPLTSTALAQPELGTFTTVDFPGAISTGGGGGWTGINPRGDIVGAYASADGNYHGFLLSQGSFTSIDFPGATSTVANGINPEGDIVGTYLVGGTFHGFLLSGDSRGPLRIRRRRRFTSIDVPGSSFTNALGINSRGDIVGRYDSAGVTHGYVFSGGEFSSIDFPDASSTQASAINSHGDIVGRYVSAGAIHGYVFSRGEFTSLDFPDANLTWAGGINSRGDIVGFYRTSAVHGFLLSGGEFSPIDFPGVGFTQALGINAHGDVVGLYFDVNGLAHVFLLSDNGGTE